MYETVIHGLRSASTPTCQSVCGARGWDGVPVLIILEGPGLKSLRTTVLLFNPLRRSQALSSSGGKHLFYLLFLNEAKFPAVLIDGPAGVTMAAEQLPDH